MNFSKLFTLLLVLTVFALSSCKDDDDSGCVTCTIATVSTEYCQSGDDVIATINGVSSTVPGTTVATLTTGQDCN